MKEVHAVTSVGARQFPAGPPQGKLTPSGGSEVHAVTSVGPHSRGFIQSCMRFMTAPVASTMG